MEDWTKDKGMGLTPPDGGGEHSGDAPDSSGELQAMKECTHAWNRGVMPGNHYIKSCSLCGMVESIDQEAFRNMR